MCDIYSAMYTATNDIKHPDIPVSEIVENDKFCVFLRNDLIVQVQIKQGHFFDVPEVTAILAAIKQVSKNNKFPILALYATNIGFSKKAKEIVAAHELTTADALVTHDNWPLRIIANLYLKVNKPVRPTRIFGDEKSAIQWLKLYG